MHLFLNTIYFTSIRKLNELIAVFSKAQKLGVLWRGGRNRSTLPLVDTRN